MSMKISSIMNKNGFIERGTVTGVFGRCSYGRPPSLWQLLKECSRSIYRGIGIRRKNHGTAAANSESCLLKVTHKHVSQGQALSTLPEKGVRVVGEKGEGGVEVLKVI